MDDGDLYTGIVPGEEMFANEQDPRELQEAKEAQQAELEALLPSVEVMKAFVDEEEKAVSDWRAYHKSLGSKPTKEQLEREYDARELYIGYLNRFRSEMIRRVTDYQEAVK